MHREFGYYESRQYARSNSLCLTHAPTKRTFLEFSIVGERNHTGCNSRLIRGSLLFASLTYSNLRLARIYGANAAGADAACVFRRRPMGSTACRSCFIDTVRIVELLDLPSPNRRGYGRTRPTRDYADLSYRYVRGVIFASRGHLGTQAYRIKPVNS